jgi:phosphomannomutase
MAENSLKFGTSGLRGLVTELEGQPTRRYTAAFLKHLAGMGQAQSGKVFIGRDFRPSSSAIAQDCAVAIAAAGLVPVDCGALPTPALALHAIANNSAAIMVTGSHIPADRNGLKFYLPTGEISKDDEAGILAALGSDDVPDHDVEPLDEAGLARQRYFNRLLKILPPGSLAGWRIGVFEHSTVARDLLTDVLTQFGAETLSLGRIDGFVPVDTEAFSDAVFAPLPAWLRDEKLDAIVSADGDGDRPLLMDDGGQFVRGDVLGLLSARFLGARSVVTPVTSNSGIERSGAFTSVVRTRVGSPYVVAAMSAAAAPVVGFEANGGTFVGRGVRANGNDLPELATRDAIVPLLCVLGQAARDGVTIAELVSSLPLQHALADRLQEVPMARTAAFLDQLQRDPKFAQAFFTPHTIASLSTVDGLQFRTDAGEMVHFRPSGNAPELRCYVEGATAEGAQSLLDWALKSAAAQVR